MSIPSRLPLSILVHALALSLGLVSVSAPLMASGIIERPDQAASQPAGGAATTCCCGTQDGRCCGMACCQVPDRQQENIPRPKGPENNRIEPLVQGMAQADLGPASAIGVHSWSAGALSCPSAEGLSLQAQQVRLQV